MERVHEDCVPDERKSFHKIVDHILSHKPGLTRSYVLGLIEERVKELEGLIDEDAAALLVARELGVPLPSTTLPGRVKLPLKDLIPGLQNVRIVARVLKVFDWRFPDGRTMVKLTMADETACVDCVAWGEVAERIAREVKPGDCVLINRAAVVRYRGRVEVKLGEGSTVERIDDPSVPPLDELAEAHNVNIVKLIVHDVIAGRNGFAAYGISREEPACALIPASLAVMHPHRGDVMLVQEPRKLTGGITRYRLTRASRVFIIGSQQISSSDFKPIDLDAEGEPTPYVLGVKGRYAAAIPSRLHSGVNLILCGQRASASILVFDDSVINDLKRIKPGTPVELTGVYTTPRGIRLTPFYCLRVLEQQPPRALSDNLSTPGCHVRVRATALSVSLKFRVMEDGDLLMGAVINVDDGTGYARAVASCIDHLETLLGASWDEIREQASLGVLPDLLAYVEEEVRGSDLLLEGYLSGDRVLAVTDLRLP